MEWKKIAKLTSKLIQYSFIRCCQQFYKSIKSQAHA